MFYIGQKTEMYQQYLLSHWKRAQSGVSQSVANLEVAINPKLFTRDKNIPRLTSNGQTLLPIAKSVLSQQQHFNQKIELLDNTTRIHNSV